MLGKAPWHRHRLGLGKKKKIGNAFSISFLLLCPKLVLKNVNKSLFTPLS
jgi:hypothetical protein